MPLAGKGFVAIWNDITDEGRSNFHEWHNREHIPERLGVPGFLRGRRYVAVAGSPRYFTLYEVAEAAVLSSEAYLARLNAPTAWTTRSVAHFRNAARSLCRTDVSLGIGSGGFIAACGFDCDPGDDEALLNRLAASTLPQLVRSADIVAAHVGRADLAASRITTAEQDGRPPNAVPRWVLIVEGSQPEALGEALSAVLQDHALAVSHRGIYQLQFALSRIDVAMA